jgi:hypothetical protein
VSGIWIFRSESLSIVFSLDTSSADNGDVTALDSIDFTGLNAFMTLTQRDLDEIEKIVDERVDDKISHLPTKDDSYQKMDELIGELGGMREDFAVLSGKV